MTEDEMVGWHHRLNGREFEQIPGDLGSVSRLGRSPGEGYPLQDSGLENSMNRGP